MTEIRFNITDPVKMQFHLGTSPEPTPSEGEKMVGCLVMAYTGVTAEVGMLEEVEGE